MAAYFMAYNPLLLENQLCFPLYACSREIVKKYKPFLDKIGLTYTQYITMLVLWEKQHINIKTLGKVLHLDSGTLTPLLKKMEAQGLINRKRMPEDERNVAISLTKKGADLRQKALDIPSEISNCVHLELEDAFTLHRVLTKMLDNL